MSDGRAQTPKRSPQEGAEPGAFSPEEQAALAEDVDLDAAMKRRVLETYRALGRASHYELLGVETTADARTLKHAYYELAATFHPDRYFRKKLGTYKSRLETVFGRLTLAHETLADGTARKEYDGYLEEQRRVRGIERMLAEAIAEAQQAEESIEREVRAQTPVPATPAAPAQVSPPPSAPSSAGRPSAPPPTRSSIRPTPISPPAAPPPSIDIAARRDALARRLMRGRATPGSSAPPASRASIAPPAMPTVAEAMDALRHRYEERVARAKAAQARKYVARGEEAVAAGDAVAAANAFRIALSLSPTDPDIEHVARDAQAKADDVLGEAYARQAAYEEKNGQWAEASRSWTRVCKVRPKDGFAHEHAANAILKANGDLHDAQRLAVHACSIEPANARYRVVLAEVYLAAGMALNARRELETAALLAPHDGTIQALMKRVGK